MNILEFNNLKAICKTKTLHKTLIDNGHRIEVAVGDLGMVQYAVETDLHGNFIANRPEHKFAKAIIEECAIHYGGGTI